MCWREHQKWMNFRRKKNLVVHFPMKAEVFPTVFIWFPAGASTIERFYQLISSITLRCAAAGAICRRLGSGSSFNRYFPRFTLTLDSYQTDRVVIHQPGLGLMRRIPSTRSATAAFTFWVTLFFICPFKGDGNLSACDGLWKNCAWQVKEQGRRCGRTMGDPSWQET